MVSDPEAFFGYSPAVADGTFTGDYRHVDCGLWVHRSGTCDQPFPTRLTLGHENRTVNGVYSRVWYLMLEGEEWLVTSHYGDPQYIQVRLYGEMAPISLEIPSYEPPADPSECHVRPTMAELSGITLHTMDGYIPPLQGNNWAGATASVSFTCAGDELTHPDLGVWGWRLTGTDMRGITNSEVFSPQGDHRWTNPLHSWVLEGDVSRPGCVRIAIQYSGMRLGHHYGFCFGKTWAALETKTAATAKIAEIMPDDLARWETLACGFMPGSMLTLTPLFAPPDPKEGSYCPTCATCASIQWRLVWNDEDIDLTWDEGDSQWQWEPNASQSYILERQADGDDGEGNYELTIKLDYDITAVSQANKTFTIAGEHDWEFGPGTIFTVAGSTANDGTYTVDFTAESSGNTTITVIENLPDDEDTVDGSVMKSLSDAATTGLSINCCYSGLLNLSLGTGETATLNAGTSYIDRLATGCHSKCDAASWSMMVTGLVHDLAFGPLSLVWYPSQGAWWFIREEILEEDILLLVACITRLADTGSGSRYVANLTYRDDVVGFDVRTAYCEFTIDEADCCEATTHIFSGSNGETFTLTASGCPEED